LEIALSEGERGPARFLPEEGFSSFGGIGKPAKRRKVMEKGVKWSLKGILVVQKGEGPYRGKGRERGGREWGGAGL